MSLEPADYLQITFNVERDLQSDDRRILPFADSLLYKRKVLEIRRLTTGVDVKRTYDVALDLQDVDKDFQPGDTIAILPENNHDEVAELLHHLNLLAVADVPYVVEIRTGTTKKKPIIPPHIPTCGTLRDLFSKRLDLRGTPKKLFLKMLLRFTTDSQEMAQLQQLCSPSGSTEYNNFIQNCDSLLHLLQSFPSCRPPVERLLEHLGPLQPRPYSISSSPLINNSTSKQLHFTFSVIDLENNLKGVCTSWLERFSNNPERSLDFYFRRPNNFRLPEDMSTPIIMIGPGTGVAPFIGFLQHRELLNLDVGAAWLFYGCRYASRDFLYKKEIDQFLQTGILTRLSCCSSRDQTEKVYVQDLIRQHNESFVNKIVRENAVVYVCGDAKNMVKQVSSTIVNCLTDVMSWSQSDAEGYMKQLQNTNRYIQDVWI
ncbi:hypothetical protein PPYR_06071 [Photinus pyralis]|uniref:Methionine synthase reductase n=1 Tax=Photinus pyralis TaxID=7054 RepID=A0A5N4ASY6_PHOPY|nr:methionine synthase reductase-like isoform X1 [Photinus pyralis]XP_031337922.1 methionine synthase reductase-like isoform X1 [Photinus pyralis]KAB0800330.1 hypothetical protein PPYR_06070 [Photinus pyralis]KAB0800331.1 hypothetical protein PPYR_06071 [Photinus pyralis]